MFRLIVACLLVVLPSACQRVELSLHEQRVKQWFESSDRLKVLCTIGMIDDLVQQIGGDYVDSLPLISGQLDPHTYEMVKGDGEKLGHAELIFYNGLGLEHGPSLKRYLDESAKAFALGDLVGGMQKERLLFVEGAIDPHIWMDVSFWAELIQPIADALAAQRPEAAEYFAERAQALRREMLEVHAELRRQLQAVPSDKRFLVTSHDAFNYFARAYLAADDETAFKDWDKRFEAPDGLAPDGQMSTTDIQEVVAHMERYQVHVIFPESNVSRDAIAKLREAGSHRGLDVHIAEVELYGDAMGAPESDEGSYLGMMKHNARVIAEHLRI
jgi:manganese/zinc/iron transport system substrate-binding protein